MRDKWLPVWIMAAAIVFSVVDTARYYDQLPQRMASHFDVQGRPNSWSGKLEFFGLVFATYVLVAAVSGLISFFARFAPRWINFPNKDHWLAPERQAETRQYISRWGLWFAAATLWLLALVIHEAVIANLRQPPQLRNIWWLLGAYFAVVALMLARFFARFWRTG